MFNTALWGDMVTFGFVGPLDLSWDKVGFPLLQADLCCHIYLIWPLGITMVAILGHT